MIDDKELKELERRLDNYMILTTGPATKEIVRLARLGLKFQKTKRHMTDLLATQMDNVANEYMRGLYNGIECAACVMEDREPAYLEPTACPHPKAEPHISDSEGCE